MFCVTRNHRGMLISKSCALCGNRIFDSCTVAGNDVELTFANDKVLAFFQVFMSNVQSVEHVTFVKDGSFGTIDVFGSFTIFFENSCRESNDASTDILDGEHKAIAKAVVSFPLFILLSEARRSEKFIRNRVLLGPFHHSIPRIGSITEAIIIDDFLIESAILSVF